eukprot:14150299-Alexandrium_andersonii.AAC.1
MGRRNGQPGVAQGSQETVRLWRWHKYSYDRAEQLSLRRRRDCKRSYPFINGWQHAFLDLSD